MHTAEIFGSSVVFVGSFNPAIFSPDWLERNNLMGSGDAEAARQNSRLVVSHELSVVVTDWFSLQALPNQLALASNGPVTPALADLAVGICTLLPHTPVTATGLNFFGHFKMTNVAEFHKVGDSLVPKGIWGEAFPNKRAGLADLTVKLQVKDGDPKDPVTKDEIRLTVQPSSRLTNGVFLQYNNHIESPYIGKDRNAAQVASQVVSDGWESSWQHSVAVFDCLLAKALAAKD